MKREDALFNDHGHKGGGNGQVESAGKAFGEGGDFRTGHAVGFADLPGLAVENPPRLCELQGMAAFPGLHQRRAVLLFHNLQLPCQRRLGHMDFPGSPVHAAGFHHGNEISVKFKIHIPSPYVRKEYN